MSGRNQEVCQRRVLMTITSLLCGGLNSICLSSHSRGPHSGPRSIVMEADRYSSASSMSSAGVRQSQGNNGFKGRLLILSIVHPLLFHIVALHVQTRYSFLRSWPACHRRKLELQCGQRYACLDASDASCAGQRIHSAIILARHCRTFTRHGWAISNHRRTLSQHRTVVKDSGCDSCESQTRR